MHAHACMCVQSINQMKRLQVSFLTLVNVWRYWPACLRLNSLISWYSAERRRDATRCFYYTVKNAGRNPDMSVAHRYSLVSCRSRSSLWFFFFSLIVTVVLTCARVL